ncbi:pheromone-processing carboxypeptidase KEX1-like [Aphis craccivora]|uniref:Pheromone-processing carboxypeptidase KEX1-like n=1 Tax=Aphis craccivora TaxID=307492 RepID=A0A6G0Y2U7_APHCR|nr:pheromone-processing carboxypeptidase KEX1-like [Aphis craccivora]
MYRLYRCNEYLESVLYCNCTDWNDSTKGTIIPTTNSECKATFQNGESARPLSKTEGDWELTEKLRLEDAKARVKETYDQHRHNNTRYTVGEVVVISPPNFKTVYLVLLCVVVTKGPLVVTEVLNGDAYRVVSLAVEGRRVYSTTVHVSQLKLWRFLSEGDDQTVCEELDVEGFDGEANSEEDDQLDQIDKEIIVEDYNEEIKGDEDQMKSRPRRLRKPPVWVKDYGC